MNDSEKGYLNENAPSLNLEQSEATENSKTQKTMKTISASVKGGAKKGETSATVIAGGESGDGLQQNFNKDRDTTIHRTNVLSPKFQLFIRSRTYLTREANAEYLSRLLKEKEELKMLPNAFHFKHAFRLVDDEIAKIRACLGRMAKVKEDGVKCIDKEKPLSEVCQETTKDSLSTVTSGKKVLLQEKIFIPVKEYPNYNFVGRILGPRGLTAKQLEEESGCRIMIRGRGSTREDSTNRENISNDHTKEELHVLVQCEDIEEIAKEKMKRAIECIHYFLIPPPDGEDELKRKQLMELSIINGTYRPTNASRLAFHNRSLLRPINCGQIGPENSIRRMSNFPIVTNGGIEDGRRTTIYDPRGIVNLPFGPVQQHPYNTAYTRQTLASLGFDMDAFEVTDCYGKRMSNKAPASNSNQVAATTAAVANTAHYPHRYGFGVPFIDPFNMPYVWNPSMNSAMFGVFDNSSNALAKDYCNQVMVGFSPTIISNGASIGGDGMAQASNASPVNLHQYNTTTTLINGTSTIRNDGSGDGQNNHH
ncbi:RNA-binding protein [Dirofilaria immitis]